MPDTTAPSIVHTPVSGQKPVGVAVPIEATVTDASGVASVKVYYRSSTGGTFSEQPLTLGGNNLWSGVIPSAAITSPGVQYYIRAVDSATAQNAAASPATAPAAWHSFTVGAPPSDTTAPSITHTPVVGPKTAGADVTVTATVTDTSGSGSVTLRFRPQGTATWLSVGMAGTGTSYSANIPALAVTAPGVDYYVEAVDASTNANKATHPATAPVAFHSFVVNALDEDGPDVTVDEVASPVTAGTPVPVAVTALDPVRGRHGRPRLSRRGRGLGHGADAGRGRRSLDRGRARRGGGDRHARAVRHGRGRARQRLDRAGRRRGRSD